MSDVGIAELCKTKRGTAIFFVWFVLLVICTPFLALADRWREAKRLRRDRRIGQTQKEQS